MTWVGDLPLNLTSVSVLPMISKTWSTACNDVADALQLSNAKAAVTGLSFEESSCVVSDESCMVVGFPWDFSGNKLVEEPSSSDAIIALADEGDSNLVALNFFSFGT